MNAPNEHDVKPAWQAFAKTAEFAELESTQKNFDLLNREVLAGSQDYSCQALQLAARTLRDALELKPTAPAPVIEPPATVTEEIDPSFPVRCALESEWNFAQRCNQYRFEKARDEDYKRRHQPATWRPNSSQQLEINATRAVWAARRQNYMRPTE